MKNEIIKQNTSQFPAQSMAVIASNEATAIGNVYGNVNVNGSIAINMPDNLKTLLSLTQQCPHSIEWIKLNRQQFHVFVLENENFNCHTFAISTETALKYTSKDIQNDFFSLTESVIAKLLKMPCLFAVKNENYKVAFQDCPAFLGRLTGIRCQENKICFDFEVFEHFMQDMINNNIQTFCLCSSTVRNQLDEEHWSIRCGDLIQIAKDMNIKVR